MHRNNDVNNAANHGIRLGAHDALDVERQHAAQRNNEEGFATSRQTIYCNIVVLSPQGSAHNLGLMLVEASNESMQCTPRWQVNVRRPLTAQDASQGRRRNQRLQII